MAVGEGTRGLVVLLLVIRHQPSGAPIVQKGVPWALAVGTCCGSAYSSGQPDGFFPPSAFHSEQMWWDSVGTLLVSITTPFRVTQGVYL